MSSQINSNTAADNPPEAQAQKPAQQAPPQQQPGKGATVIIKKKIKGRHKGGHHGGAWKVAYADFVTAMMALFMVLWLVAVMSIDSKKAISEYFRSYTIFKGTEAGGGKGVSVMKGNPVMLSAESGGEGAKSSNAAKTVAIELEKIIDTKLTDLKRQVLIFTTDDGVRIEMIDGESDPMFESGKNNLLKNGQKIIEVLSSAFKGIPYNITIEGHTDSYKYPAENYTNWELAADRANSARRELIKNGLDPARITKVTSFADAVPLKPENKYDPANRRVSILIETNQGKL
ncbi:MAG: OmpA family protein [Deltaproteobacteria bacterium]|nr:OmpA family protein [Deltaproteobacteria bacterium]